MAVDLLQEALERAEIKRSMLNDKMAKVEKPEKELGTYVGFWKGPLGNGRGEVVYQGKTYNAKMINSASIPKNKKVTLTIAEKDYYVSW